MSRPPADDYQALALAVPAGVSGPKVGEASAVISGPLRRSDARGFVLSGAGDDEATD